MSEDGPAPSHAPPRHALRHAMTAEQIAALRLRRVKLYVLLGALGGLALAVAVIALVRR